MYLTSVDCFCCTSALQYCITQKALFLSQRIPDLFMWHRKEKADSLFQSLIHSKIVIIWSRKCAFLLVHLIFLVVLPGVPSHSFKDCNITKVYNLRLHRKRWIIKLIYRCSRLCLSWDGSFLPSSWALISLQMFAGTKIHLLSSLYQVHTLCHLFPCSKLLHKYWILHVNCLLGCSLWKYTGLT